MTGRNWEKEFDDLKKALVSDFVMIKEGVAKPAGDKAFDQIVTFDKPFPDNYDIKTVWLNISGFTTGSSNTVWEPKEITNKSFRLHVPDGFDMPGWPQLSLRYYAIAIRTKL